MQVTNSAISQNHFSTMLRQNQKNNPLKNGTVSAQISPTNQDTYTKSSQKQSGYLNSFAEQIENLMKQKDDFISQTIEKGQDIEDVRDILNDFDKQIDELNNQFQKAWLQEQNKKLTENTKSPDTEKVKTNKEIELEKMNHIVAADNEISHIEEQSNVQKKLEGESNVLKSEMELDTSHRNGILDSKKEAVADISGQAASVKDIISVQLAHINNEIIQNNQEQVENNTDTEKTHKESQVSTEEPLEEQTAETDSNSSENTADDASIKEDNPTEQTKKSYGERQYEEIKNQEKMLYQPYSDKNKEKIYA